MAFYRLSIFSKMKELELYGTRDKIIKIYAKEAEKVLASYEEHR
jgi:hypothetical protein